jgi:hypothetical protein
MVCGDDGGNVVAYRCYPSDPEDIIACGGAAFFEASLSRGHQKSVQLWSSRTTKGIPFALAICDVHPAIAVGTSIGDILLLNASHGHIERTFSHHKGPISTVVCHLDVFYACGWHESLRSYRYSVAEEIWFPAEVKRRTLYHEASNLRILQKYSAILLGSRDGTVMSSPLAHCFTSPAQYLNVVSQFFVYAKVPGVVVQSRGVHLNAFRRDGCGKNWLPFFSLKHSDNFPCRGLWCDDRLTLLCVASDVSVDVFRVQWNCAESIEKIDVLLHLDVAGAVDVTFDRSQDPGIVLVLCAYELHAVSVDVSRRHERLTLESCNGDFQRLHCVRNPKNPFSGVAILTGERGIRCYQLNLSDTGAIIDRDSFSLVSSDPFSYSALIPRQSEDAVVEDHMLVGLFAHRYHQTYMVGWEHCRPSLLSAERLNPTLPHDCLFIQWTSAGDLIGHFPRGLISHRLKAWHVLKRCTVAAVFADASQGLVLLERNIEGEVESLPPCWKVRRFGN